MKKLFSLLAIAALIMLCGCSKSETDPEASENSFDFTFTCAHCGQEYILRTEGDPDIWLDHIYAVVDGELILVGDKLRRGPVVTINCIGKDEDGTPCNYPMFFP